MRSLYSCAAVFRMEIDPYMKMIRCQILLVLFALIAAAQTSGTLPPRIAALVPQGAKISSQNFTSVPTMAVAAFAAQKSIGTGRSVEYRLEIRAFDNNSPTWRFKQSAYQRQIEARVASKRSGLKSEGIYQGVFTADPVKETKYAWGTGLTQRILNHPPRAKEYVDYQCSYFGMIGGITFELFASGVPDSPAEADRWAQSVAETVSKLSVSNIGQK